MTADLLTAPWIFHVVAASDLGSSELDLVAAAMLERRLDESLASFLGPPAADVRATFVVDATEVTLLSAAAIAALETFARRARDAGVRPRVWVRRGSSPARVLTGLAARHSLEVDVRGAA